MKWLLLIALLPTHATSPSTFTFNGYDSEAKCQHAAELIKHDGLKLGGKVIVWASCMPGNDAQ